MTLVAIWTFLRSPLGRKIAFGVAIAIAAALVARHLIEVGRVRGESAATQRAMDSIAKLKDADTAGTKEQLEAHDRKLQVLEESAAASRAQANQLGAMVLELGRQRTAAVAKVDQVPDAGLHAFNVDQLRIRGPDDRAACYLPAEERAIGKCLAAQPFFDQEVAKASGRADKLETEVREVQAQVQEHEEKFRDLAAYTTRVEGYYVSLYNATAKKKRGGKCVWLWSCVRPQLPAPDPSQFLGKQLQTSAGRPEAKQ
jgi:hypothetical protein